MERTQVRFRAEPDFVLRKQKNFESAINHLSFFVHPRDGDCLVMSDQAGSIDFWELKRSRREVFSLSVSSFDSRNRNEQMGIIWSEVLFLSSGNQSFYLISQCRNGNVYFFQMEANKEMRSYHSEDCRLIVKVETNFTAFCKCDLLSTERNHSLVVPADENGSCFFWVYPNVADVVLKVESASKLEIACPTQYGLAMSAKLALIEGMLRIVAAFEIGAVVVFCCDSKAVLTKISLQPDEQNPCTLTCLACNRDCSTIAVGSVENHIQIISLRHSTSHPNSSQLELTKAKTVSLPKPGVSCLEFRPDDDRLLISAGWDSTIRYFSSRTYKTFAVLDGLHTSTVVALRFHGKTLFSACKDGKVASWSLFCE